MRLGDLDALKEAIRKRLGISSLKYLTEQEKVIVDEIDNAPTVEERLQSEWIPVSERLPERYKEVIVTDNEVEDTYCSWYIGNGYWMCDNGVKKNRIIAWKPFPEPYESGGAEND